MKLRQHVISYGILLAVLIFFLIMPNFFPGLQKFSDPEFTRSFILSFGTASMFAYILLIVGSIPLPIPSTAVILAGGYIFGIAKGITLSIIGIAAGSSIAFLMVRKAGKPLLRKVVDIAQIEHLGIVLKHHRNTAVLLSYALPIFPSDMLSFFLGFTRMKYYTFLTLLILGHIPRLLLINAIGSDFHTGFSPANLWLYGIASAFVLIALFRNYLRKLFFRELRIMKKEAGFIEKNIEVQLTQLSKLFRQ